MDQSTRGDEPEAAEASAEAKEGAPAQAKAVTSPREAAADAIPTVAPHPPRGLSQAPSPPETFAADATRTEEEESAAESASEAIVRLPEPTDPLAEATDTVDDAMPAAKPGPEDDGQADTAQADAAEVPPEPRVALDAEPVPGASSQVPEPSSPQAYTDEGVEGGETDAIDPTPGDAAQPDSTEPSAPPEDTGMSAVEPRVETFERAPAPSDGMTGSVEKHEDSEAGEAEPETAVESAISHPPANEASPPPEPAEPTLPDPILGEPANEVAPEPRAVPEEDTTHPVAADADAGTWNIPPSKPAQSPAHSDVSTTPVTSEPLQTGETVSLPADAQPDDDLLPPDDAPTPLGEEEIWTGPEALGPNEDDAGQNDARREPPAENDARGEDAARTDRNMPDAAFAGMGPTPAPSLPGWRPGTPAAWPAVSLPSPERIGHARSYLGLAARTLAGVVLALTAIVLLLIVAYRWVDPPTSTLMLGQRLMGTQIEQEWVPLRRISSHVVHAVILSEDGGFCRHRGVDWSALQEAIEDSRGGSTITMQVVKNLFLWPSRSYVRKALEIVLAYVVEIVWSKQRVLEIYLNIAEWGQGVFGVQAAAHQHFGRSAAKLSAQEAALLAVSLPSPIERRAGYPGWQTRRLASNLLIRMRAVRAPFRCVRVGRGGT